MTMVIKMTRKSRRSNIFCKDVERSEKYMFLPPTPDGPKGRLEFESHLAAGHEGVKTRMNTSRDNEKIVKKFEPGCTAVRTAPRGKNVRIRRWNVEENSRPPSAPSFHSLSQSIYISIYFHYIWFLFVQLTCSTQPSSSVYSSKGYLKTAATNKFSVSEVRRDFIGSSSFPIARL